MTFANRQQDGAASGTTPALLRRILAPLRRVFGGVASLGISGYPPDTQRRLKIVNLISALIATTTFLYAVHLAMSGDDLMRPAAYINLGLALIVALVPLMHRINDMAGSLLLVAAEFSALIGFTAFFGREGGAPLQYIVAAAAPFVIFERRHFWLVIVIVFTALVLHLVAWFSFATSAAGVHVAKDILNSLYIQGAVTTFGLIAACVYYAFHLAERAKAETDTVLRNVLPEAIVERLKASPGETIADGFTDASVLFADITGFVAIARDLGPEKTVALLNRLVSTFDTLAQRHGVEKIKTIGDAYMVASGVPTPRDDHAVALAAMAVAMIDAVRVLSAAEKIPLNLRIGMASGPMMAGVIGINKFSYDVWGDPVNLASRLEQASAPGRILVCPACRDALEHHFAMEERGTLDIKGVGQVAAWYVNGGQHRL